MMVQNVKKATDFYKIQDATASNIPVDEKHDFYVDFSEFRRSFQEKKIYRNLSINARTKECTELVQPRKIFLSGYRGTGKTSELLKLNNAIDDTKCYFTIFVDISDEELDTNNIQTVDILILMLEKLLEKLQNGGASIEDGIIESFYTWYSTRIEEVKTSTSASVSREAEVSASTSFLSFLKLTAKTKSQLKGSGESKETIRRVFNQHFSDFVTKFNEFILTTKGKLQNSSSSYRDILFIIDGFEKIGSYADRKKILIEDSNKFTLIRTHMLITLPIELFNEMSILTNFGTILRLPLIDLELPGAKEKIKEFILKRVDRKLFKDEDTIDEIIQYGAGHPRQTLQIISRAYTVADEDILDLKSVKDAVQEIGQELSSLNQDEMQILQDIKNDKTPSATDAYIRLKEKNILFEYSDEKIHSINPVLESSSLFQKRLESLDA